MQLILEKSFLSGGLHTKIMPLTPFWVKTKKQFSAAHAHYKIILKLDPNNAGAKWSISLLQLITGDFKQGWENYEYRYHKDKKNKVVTMPDISSPQYQGVDLKGKNILVYFEQGLGDEFQFIRYLPLLKTQKGVRGIILVCKPPDEVNIFCNLPEWF
jgi:hypothetical protein